MCVRVVETDSFSGNSLSTARAESMFEEPNGNNMMNVKLSSNCPSMASSPSADDISQSLSASEYTDADESMSAPTEFLAEVRCVF